MIIILIFLFVFIIEDYFFVSLVNIRFKYFVRTLSKSYPIVSFIIKIIKTNIRISIRYANIISFVFKNSGNLFQHFSGVLFRICSTLKLKKYVLRLNQVNLCLSHNQKSHLSRLISYDGHLPIYLHLAIYLHSRD